MASVIPEGYVLPCSRNPALFDSEDYNDHVIARSICVRCEAVEWCMTQLVEAKRAAKLCDGSEGPMGTWAGQFMPNQRRMRSHKAKAS